MFDDGKLGTPVIVLTVRDASMRITKLMTTQYAVC